MKLVQEGRTDEWGGAELDGGRGGENGRGAKVEVSARTADGAYRESKTDKVITKSDRPRAHQMSH